MVGHRKNLKIILIGKILLGLRTVKLFWSIIFLVIILESNDIKLIVFN